MATVRFALESNHETAIIKQTGRTWICLSVACKNVNMLFLYLCKGVMFTDR